MKAKYNKRAIMKRAWEIKRSLEGRRFNYSFSRSLRYSWQEAKKNAARMAEYTAKRNMTGEYSQAAINERRAQINHSYSDMSSMANTLTDYYANNRYNGD